MPASDAVIPLYPAAAILLAFAVKHFLADFIMQTTALAHGKEREHGWAIPLALHAGCHGALTLVIALAVAPRLWEIALADFAIHYFVDRGKVLLVRRTGWTPSDPHYWWAFGLDQFLHQVTNIGLALTLLAG